MRPIPLLLALLVSPPALADVFKCVDAEGRTTYTNNPSVMRGCTRLITEPPLATSPAAPRPSAAAPGASTTPATFPRVAPDAQRARDDTRRQVLERELASEERALATARQALSDEERRLAAETPALQRTASGDERLKPLRDRIELHQRNLDALRREISNLR